MRAWWRLSGRVGLGLLIGTVVMGVVQAARDHVVVVGDAVLRSDAGPPLLFAGALVVGALRAASIVLPRVRNGPERHPLAREPGWVPGIVEERAFLMAGRGEVHLLPPGAFLAHPVGTCVTDDGYRPVESGSYTLTWTNQEGHLDPAASPGASVQTVGGGGRVTCSAYGHGHDAHTGKTVSVPAIIALIALIALVGVLGACSTSAPDQSAGNVQSHATASVAPSATASAAALARAATTPTCGTPPVALVDQASVGIASHPGAITATAYVFAATTDTGDWYVLGLDRDYVHDDGSSVGEHSRSLALTNRARTTDGQVAMIPLTVALSAKLPVSWERVSWTGDTLAAGRRAVERAIACLDEQRR